MGCNTVTCRAKSPAEGIAGIVVLGRKHMGGLGVMKKLQHHIASWQVACADLETNPQRTSVLGAIKTSSSCAICGSSTSRTRLDNGLSKPTYWNPKVQSRTELHHAGLKSKKKKKKVASFGQPRQRLTGRSKSGVSLATRLVTLSY